MQAAAIAAAAGLSWGVALWGPAGFAGLLLGLAALPGAVLGQPRRDAARGALLAVCWMSLALSWFPETWASFGGPGGRWMVVPLVAFEALPTAAAFALAGALVRAKVGRGPALAVAGAVIAGLSAWTPVPLLPAHAAASLPWLAWPAGWVGRSGLCAILLGVAGLCWDRPRRGLGAVAAVAAVGCATSQVLPRLGAARQVGVVEPGTGAFEGRMASTAEARATRLLSGLSALPPVDFAVAPEGAWPFDPGGPDGGRRAALASAWSGVVPTAVGADQGEGNSLLVIQGGQVTGRFDKQLLVPGSERRWLGLGRDRYVAGHGPRSLEIAGVTLGPMVCYEDLFPSAVRGAARAEILLAAANDGWNGPGAWAHLAAARLAALETGRWVLRPTTSGASAVIDPVGRLAWSTPFVDRDEHPQEGPRSERVEIRLPPGPLPGPWVGAAVPWVAAAWSALRLGRSNQYIRSGGSGRRRRGVRRRVLAEARLEEQRRERASERRPRKH
jgi:apolipoprotein N-acyltransferase